MTLTQSRTGRAIALAFVAAMLLASGVVTPASAQAHQPVVAAVEGTATLDAGISADCETNTYTGSFEGTVIVGAHGIPPVAMVDEDASAEFLYCNQNTVTGTAAGTLWLGDDAHECGFTWTRVGLTAVVVFDDGCIGAAVAGFVPDDPNAVPATATVGGAGVTANSLP